MPLTTIRVLASAAAASLLLIGCGGEESAPEPEESAPQSVIKLPPGAPPRNKIVVEKLDPDGKGMELSATDPEGKKFRASIGDSVEIPEEFPKDVPIFPGSTPMAYLFSPDEGVIVTFKSVEEQEDIFDFYQSSLAEDGWDLLEDETKDGRLSFEALKEGRKISVVVAGTKGDSRVSVIVTSEDSEH